MERTSLRRSVLELGFKGQNDMIQADNGTHKEDMKQLATIKK
jgi:hypothetical protein